jgi:hypothetical protein
MISNLLKICYGIKEVPSYPFYYATLASDFICVLWKIKEAPANGNCILSKEEGYECHGVAAVIRLEYMYCQLVNRNRNHLVPKGKFWT